MLDPSWLPGIRSDLYLYEGVCMNHIKNGTFDEQPFIDYFKNWDSYYYIISTYGVKDLYDASNLHAIAEYYNEKTQTTNYYNPSTGVKGTQPLKYYQNSTSEPTTSSVSDAKEERIKNIALGVGIGIVLLLMIKSCARGEEVTNKYTLVDKNNKKIEFFNDEYQQSND